MVDVNSIARPYATAAFEYAWDHEAVAPWRNFFKTIELFFKNSQLQPFMQHPERYQQRLADVLFFVFNKQLSQAQRNFLNLINKNKRFNALPGIAVEFYRLCDKAEAIQKIHLTTALPVDDQFKSAISSALSKRLKKTIHLACDIDPSIIGGGIIKIGNRVIDGSVLGKINRLLESTLR